MEGKITVYIFQCKKQNAPTFQENFTSAYTDNIWQKKITGFIIVELCKFCKA